MNREILTRERRIIKALIGLSENVHANFYDLKNFPIYIISLLDVLKFSFYPLPSKLVHYIPYTSKFSRRKIFADYYFQTIRENNFADQEFRLYGILNFASLIFADC